MKKIEKKKDNNSKKKFLKRNCMKRGSKNMKRRSCVSKKKCKSLARYACMPCCPPRNANLWYPYYYCVFRPKKKIYSSFSSSSSSISFSPRRSPSFQPSSTLPPSTDIEFPSFEAPSYRQLILSMKHSHSFQPNFSTKPPSPTRHDFSFRHAFSTQHASSTQAAGSLKHASSSRHAPSTQTVAFTRQTSSFRHAPSAQAAPFSRHVPITQSVAFTRQASSFRHEPSFRRAPFTRHAATQATPSIRHVPFPRHISSNQLPSFLQCLSSTQPPLSSQLFYQAQPFSRPQIFFRSSSVSSLHSGKSSSHFKYLSNKKPVSYRQSRPEEPLKNPHYPNSEIFPNFSKCHYSSHKHPKKSRVALISSTVPEIALKNNVLDVNSKAQSTLFDEPRKFFKYAPSSPFYKKSLKKNFNLETNIIGNVINSTAQSKKNAFCSHQFISKNHFLPPFKLPKNITETSTDAGLTPVIQLCASRTKHNKKKHQNTQIIIDINPKKCKKINKRSLNPKKLKTKFKQAGADCLFDFGLGDAVTGRVKDCSKKQLKKILKLKTCSDEEDNSNVLNENLEYYINGDESQMFFCQRNMQNETLICPQMIETLMPYGVTSRKESKLKKKKKKFIKNFTQCTNNFAEVSDESPNIPDNTFYPTDINVCPQTTETNVCPQTTEMNVCPQSTEMKFCPQTKEMNVCLQTTDNACCCTNYVRLPNYNFVDQPLRGNVLTANKLTNKMLVPRLGDDESQKKDSRKPKLRNLFYSESAKNALGKQTDAQNESNSLEMLNVLARKLRPILSPDASKKPKQKLFNKHNLLKLYKLFGEF